MDFSRNLILRNHSVFLTWIIFTENLEFHRLMNVCSKLKSGVHWHGFDSYFRLWIIHVAWMKKTFAKWNNLKSKPTLLDCPTQLIWQAQPHIRPRDQNIASMQKKMSLTVEYFYRLIEKSPVSLLIQWVSFTLFESTVEPSPDLLKFIRAFSIQSSTKLQTP